MTHLVWKETIGAFEAGLPAGSMASVHDLCAFLLREEQFGTAQRVCEYLTDYLIVSRAKLGFHEKWKDLSNMKNIAEYDRKEIEVVSALLAQLRTHARSAV